MKRPPRPVTILTGFLGSGKTTLINSLLQAPDRAVRYAVLVNEVGSVGLDGALIASAADGLPVYQLENGCLCCMVQGEFLRVCKELTKRWDFDHLIIETSGAADPVPVAQPFLNAEGLGHFFHLDAIVTVVDVVDWQRNKRREALLEAQVRAGDFLILTKLDEAEALVIEAVRFELKQLNPHAMQVEGDLARKAPGVFMDSGAFDLETHLRMDPAFEDEFARRHGDDFEVVAWSAEGCLVGDQFEAAIQELIDTQAIYRCKGMVALQGSKERGILHGVNNRLHLIWGERWGGREVPRTDLVFIGRGLNEKRIHAVLAKALEVSCG